MPKARARGIISAPIFPTPTRPSVRPNKPASLGELSSCSILRGVSAIDACPQSGGRARASAQRRVQRRLSNSCRDSLKRRCHAASAAATSMVLNPAPARTTSFDLARGQHRFSHFCPTYDEHVRHLLVDRFGQGIVFEIRLERNVAADGLLNHRGRTVRTCRRLRTRIVCSKVQCPRSKVQCPLRPFLTLDLVRWTLDLLKSCESAVRRAASAQTRLTSAA